jgi:hypothetical protein
MVKLMIFDPRDSNWLSIFKVKGQDHGEIDISCLIISDISTCGTDRNMSGSIFMFGFML